VRIAIILTLGLSSFILGTIWEIKQFLITADQQPYTKLMIFQHLWIMSILAIATTTAIATLFIRKSLFPLRQVNQWVTNYAELDYCQLNFHQTPSELKALALTWKQLLTQIKELKQQQQQFTNDLAHELRTPLSMVYAYLQRTWQRSHNLTATQQETLEMAVFEAERMTQILQNLLDLARANHSMMPLQPESLILNDVIADIVQMIEKFEHRVIHLEITPLPVRVKADRKQLMQALNHLINNAVKYSNADKLVSLQLTQADNWAVIQVSDKGDGIPLSEQSRIFEPLYRVDASRAHLTEGAGLGLSIVKYLVESMGGKVAIQSNLGYGNTFILTLPTLGTKI
jgi:signal transduction histidine kinase